MRSFEDRGAAISTCKERKKHDRQSLSVQNSSIQVREHILHVINHEIKEHELELQQ